MSCAKDQSSQNTFTVGALKGLAKKAMLMRLSKHLPHGDDIISIYIHTYLTFSTMILYGINFSACAITHLRVDTGESELVQSRRQVVNVDFAIAVAIQLIEDALETLLIFGRYLVRHNGEGNTRYGNGHRVDILWRNSIESVGR